MSKLQLDILEEINKAINNEESVRAISAGKQVATHNHTILTLITLRDKLVESGLLYVPGQVPEIQGDIALPKHNKFFRVWRYFKFRNGTDSTFRVGKVVKTIEQARELIELEKKPKTKKWYEPETIDKTGEYDIVSEKYIITFYDSVDVEEEITIEERVAV